MRKSTLLTFGALLTASLFTLWGCPKKAQISTVPETGQAETASGDTQAGMADESASGGQEGAAGQDAASASSWSPRAAGSHTAEKGLKPIYFDFDQALLRGDAKSALAANAAWLRDNPRVKIRIEGNCDDLGAKEYNVALGQRRAESAKKYLTGLGISGSRVSLISYGKEKPLCASLTETCRQKNRRDDFVVVAE